MDKFTVIIGIDVSKASLAVCLSHEGHIEHFQVDNTIKGLSGLVNQLHRYEKDAEKILVCCENTGAYSQKLAIIASGAGLFFWMVHPVIIARYIVDMNRSKTDPSDAERIMNFAFAHTHKAVKYKVPDPETQKLSALFNLRRHYVNNRQRELNYLQSLQDAIAAPYCTESIRNTIALLDAKIKEVENNIMQFISQNQVLKKQYKLLMTIPGIGPIIAQRFLFITECFQKFKNWKSLACYVGSAPFKYQSGTSVKRKERTSKKRHQPFKSELFEGVMSVATRPGQFFYDYYQTMKAINQHHLKIINNIINIILKLAFTIITSDKPFDAKLFINQKKSWQQNLVMS